jgi:hypothetical protein
MVTVTINYKNGTTDRRNVPYSEISSLRAKPTISSVEVSSNKVSYPAGEKYEKNYGRGGKNTVGDRDGDGTKEPDRHEYAGVKDKAIKKAMSSKKKLKGYGVSEGFSNWRQDLNEVMGVDDEIAARNEKQIKEKKVDNYGGGKNSVVKINPEVTEEVEILGGHIVETFELDESYVDQVIEIATDFFYNCGLNENGVDIVIEELGEEKFNEFVFDLAEEYFLSEARTLTGKKKSPATGKELGTSRKAAPGKTTKAAVEKHGTTRTLSSSTSSGTIKKKDIGKKITADKAKEAVGKAKETQADSSEKSTEGNKKGIAGRLGAALGAVVKKGKEDIARVSDAAQTARNVATRRGAEAKAVYDALRERGKNAEQSATATRARRKATVAAGRAAQSAGKAAIKTAGAAGAAVGSGVAARRRGASAAGVAGAALGAGLRKLTREELELQEKAESEQQQKLFGLALSVKRGETPRSEASAEVLKIVDDMSEKKIRDFAKTPHSEVPKKKINEAIANPTPEKKSPSTTRKQKETGRIVVLQKLLDLAKGNQMREDMEPQTQKQIAARNLELRAEKMRVAADQQALQQKKKQQTQQEPQTQNASYEPEGELVDERTRYAKETGKHFRTGRPSVEGGDPEVAARNKAPFKYGGSRQAPKVHGEKPPVAGEPGSGRQNPAHKVALRRAARQRAAEFKMDTKGT